VETLAKADIFFVISTIAVTLVAVSIVVFVWYAIVLIRRIRQLCERVEDDLYTVRTEARQLMTRVQKSYLFKFLFTKYKK
jgi:uncharacterized protein YoxC